MQVRKVVISTTVGLGMGAMAFAGAGAASADVSHGQNGAPGAPGVSVSHVSVASGNKLFSGNKLSALNGNRVLSGNRTTVKLEVNILNGAFSNNILNSGANSFNTSETKNYNSFNTVTVTKTTLTDSQNTIDSNNTSSDCQGNCAGSPGKPGAH